MTTPKQPTAAAQPQSTRRNERDLILTHHEAEAGGPMDVAACGEEDPGAALESLVTREEVPAEETRRDLTPPDSNAKH